METIKEKVLKKIKNLKKLQDLFNENSKVIFGNQEDIDTLKKDFEKAIELTLKEVEHKHQVSIQCARDGMKETCIEIIEKKIKWQKDLIEQAGGQENTINTCECTIHQLEEIIKQLMEENK